MNMIMYIFLENRNLDHYFKYILFNLILFANIRILKKRNSVDNAITLKHLKASKYKY